MFLRRVEKNDISRLRVKIYWLKKILILPINCPRCSITGLLTFQDVWSIRYFIYFAMKTERLLAFILIDFLRDFLAFNMHIKVVKLNINWIGTLTHEKFKKTTTRNWFRWKRLENYSDVSLCIILLFFVDYTKKWIKFSFLIIFVSSMEKNYTNFFPAWFNWIIVAYLTHMRKNEIRPSVEFSLL